MTIIRRRLGWHLHGHYFWTLEDKVAWAYPRDWRCMAAHALRLIAERIDPEGRLRS